MKLFKKIVSLVFILLILLNTIPSYQETASASQKVTVLQYQGEIDNKIKYQNEIWTDYPNPEYGDYPETITYNENGYSGTLKATRIKLVPQNKKDQWVKDRTKTFKDDWTSNWVNNKDEVSSPTSVKGSYFDEPSGKNVSYTLKKSGGLKESDHKVDWFEYRSEGRADNYDKDNNRYLGFMSNDSETYYAGKWTDKKPGDAPDSFYGDPFLLGMYDWKLVDYGWDESKVVNADDWAKKGTSYANKLVKSDGEYWWRSESGRLNKYRRGVWIDYEVRINLYKYKQDYQATVDLPDYVDYQYSDKWKVYVEYEGTSYSSNLTADDIVIKDLRGNVVNTLIKGKQYQAEITYSNTGELRAEKHKIALYEDDKLLKETEANSLEKGNKRTHNIAFTADNTGKKVFKAKIDSSNLIQETNELDNEVSINKTINYVNLKAQSIVFVDSNEKEQKHLVKGKTYKAKVTYLNESEIVVPEHKVLLSEEKESIAEVTTTSIEPNKARTVYLNFTAAHSGDSRDFQAFVDSGDDIEETNEDDNKVDKSMLVNTIPSISLDYSPHSLFEGDSVNIIMNPEDEDNDRLTVTLEMQNGSNWTQIYTKSNVIARTTLNKGLDNLEPREYNFRAIVTDEHGESAQSTLEFSVTPLKIAGKVEHTDKWRLIHEQLGSSENQFFSGEKFILSAAVTDHPIDYVTVQFIGSQINGSILDKTINLLQNPHPIYTGEFYDISMSDTKRKLQNGSAQFIFVAKWKNGVTKVDQVPIEIIDDIYGAFDFFRSS
ncbi:MULTISPECIES: CARDB domain-containing protein [Bacilli]|uniref:CARDB domain-containing protein n=1 Tax=Bacilli TaxID=91061 RepID=UPI002553E5D9|nr:CARDB domain-containing protein [Streptococcus agalactiae]MDK8746839.1 CARDB domain-containing protein [Streptococcus agalactiae]